MEKEFIRPWVARYRNSHGVEVQTVGVDIVNHRVIYRQKGYPHDCVCPCREWSKKFKREPS